MSNNYKKIDFLLKKLEQENFENITYVTGSVAQNAKKPGDLDIFIDLRDTPHSRELLDTFDNLLKYGNRASGNYGLFDPFIMFKDKLISRNDMSNGWQKAHNEKELKQAFLKHKKKLSTVLEDRASCNRIDSIYDNTEYNALEEHINYHHDIFKIDSTDIFAGEGYRYYKEDYSKPLFGTKFATDFQLAAFYHEYAHAIDAVMENPEKVLLPSFGMHYKTKVTVFDVDYDNPVTYQATNRECRVTAIQAKLYAHVFNISEKKALEETLEKNSKSLLLMEDILNVKTPEDMSYENKEQYRLDFIQSLIKHHFNDLSIKHILEETNTVSEYRNYQQWSNRELKKHAFHDVFLEDLAITQGNLLNLWPEIEDTISLEDINNKNNSSMLSNPLKQVIVSRISSIIENKNFKPVNINVNKEQVSIDPQSKYQLAAAALTSKKMIQANIQGDKEDIISASIYGPNVFQREVEKRLENKKLVTSRKIGI